MGRWVHVCVHCGCFMSSVRAVSLYLYTPSFMEAIQFGRQGSFDGFLAVGGGSVMDSAKVANLFACYPESDLMDFVTVPFGKGNPILKQLKPLICGELGWVLVLAS